MSTKTKTPTRRKPYRLNANSLAAYHKHSEKLFPTRRAAIRAALEHLNRPATDKEIMKCLSFTDPNRVRPRITEAVDEGELVAVDERLDQETGVHVRVVWFKGRPIPEPPKPKPDPQQALNLGV